MSADHRTPQLLTIGRGPTHIILRCAEGVRGYGPLHAYSEDGLRDLDIELDYHDAANEDASGLLPHERAPIPARVRETPTADVIALPAPRRYRNEAWTQEAIIDCIQAWTRAWERPPTYHEWAQRTSAEWPTAVTVARRFGGRWNNAIIAAGLQPIAESHNRRREAA